MEVAESNGSTETKTNGGSSQIKAARVHKIDGNGVDLGPQSKIAKTMSDHSNAGPTTKFETNKEGHKIDVCDDAFTMGDVIIEGKTKIVYNVNSKVPGRCLVVSKDVITAGDGAKKNVMQGKAETSNSTNAAIMQILNEFGIKTAFIKQVNRTSFLAWKCQMIPIEWVSRRIATGSFLKRHKGVNEGYRFCPPKLETFYKDDENHDPQWSREVLEEAKLKIGDRTITPADIDTMEKTTVAIFEILEQVWKTRNVGLVDMKIEFGLCEATNSIILADVIDNDSWRIWPDGDKKQMKDKQVYRNLTKPSAEEMQQIKQNYEWVVDHTSGALESVLSPKTQSKVDIIMGSGSDLAHCKNIKSLCDKFGFHTRMHVASAHKTTNDVLKIVAEIEADALVSPSVIIAVAGRSNGLGPVISGNTILPVINCPPITEKWGTSDIWSSLRLPSGLGCTTAMSPDGAAIAAAQVVSRQDLKVWGTLRAHLLNNWLTVREADVKLEN